MAGQEGEGAETGVSFLNKNGHPEAKRECQKVFTIGKLAVELAGLAVANKCAAVVEAKHVLSLTYLASFIDKLGKLQCGRCTCIDASARCACLHVCLAVSLACATAAHLQMGTFDDVAAFCLVPISVHCNRQLRSSIQFGRNLAILYDKCCRVTHRGLSIPSSIAM